MAQLNATSPNWITSGCDPRIFPRRKMWSRDKPGLEEGRANA